MGEKFTILIVDDEPDLRFIAGEFLKDSGYDVQEASNGCEALECLEVDSVGIDMVLTDLAMPVMNGVELIIQIQQIWERLKAANFG